jgi:O-antigen ligase
LLLSYRERRHLILTILAIGIVSAFVGLLQVAQGQESSLRFFKITNPEEAVGFFANRNHFAALLYCLIPFIGAWTMAKTTEVGKSGPFLQRNLFSIMWGLFGFTVLVLILAAEITARSRAGLALTVFSLLGVLALSLSNRGVARISTQSKIIVGALVVALAFSMQYGFHRLLGRAADSLQGARPTMILTTIEAAKAYLPLGSGLGTFVPVYAMFEKPQHLALFYANRAHNDYLELWLETGVLGLIMIGIFTIWLARRSVEIWRKKATERGDGLDLSLTRAATIALGLLMVHSVFDYPLRTGAMMAIFAVSCALMIEPIRASAGASGLDRRTTRSAATPLPAPAKELVDASQSRATSETARPAFAASQTAEFPKSLEQLRLKIEQLHGREKPLGGPVPDARSLPGKGPEAETNPFKEQQHGRESSLKHPFPAAKPVPAKHPEAETIPPDRRWGDDVEWPEAWSKKQPKADEP